MTSLPAQSPRPDRSRTLSGQPVWVRFGAPTIGALALIAGGLLTLRASHGQFHAPDLSLIAKASPAIRIHLFAALAAAGLGAVQMLAPKGTIPHRTMGWVWVVLMLLTAGSSLLIKVINHGHFSLIHLLSGWTLIAVPLGLLAARRKNIAAHSRFMAGLFYMGLIAAGAFTVLPGRLLYQVFIGS
jgi:uncharacterized membrane protein